LGKDGNGQSEEILLLLPIQFPKILEETIDKKATHLVFLTKEGETFLLGLFFPCCRRLVLNAWHNGLKRYLRHKCHTLFGFLFLLLRCWQIRLSLDRLHTLKKAIDRPSEPKVLLARPLIHRQFENHILLFDGCNWQFWGDYRFVACISFPADEKRCGHVSKLHPGL